MFCARRVLPLALLLVAACDKKSSAPASAAPPPGMPPLEAAGAPVVGDKAQHPPTGQLRAAGQCPRGHPGRPGEPMPPGHPAMPPGHPAQGGGEIDPAAATPGDVEFDPKTVISGVLR